MKVGLKHLKLSFIRREKVNNSPSFPHATWNEEKLDIKKLQKILTKTKDMKSRNRLIVKSYQQGYSQHMMAKVLGVSQAAIYGVIKRSRK